MFGSWDDLFSAFSLYLNIQSVIKHYRSTRYMIMRPLPVSQLYTIIFSFQWKYWGEYYLPVGGKSQRILTEQSRNKSTKPRYVNKILSRQKLLWQYNIAMMSVWTSTLINITTLTQPFLGRFQYVASYSHYFCQVLYQFQFVHINEFCILKVLSCRCGFFRNISDNQLCYEYRT